MGVHVGVGWMKVGEENFHMEEIISIKPLRQENQSHLNNYQRPVGLSNENEGRHLTCV